MAAAAFAGAGGAALAEQPIPVADPGMLEAGRDRPTCCGVPPRGEVTADQVFGRWVVMRASIGASLRADENVAFSREGTLATARGPCSFAVLRAELTIACAGNAEAGEVRFDDDTKLIWRHQGRETVFLAPAD